MGKPFAARNCRARITVGDVQNYLFVSRVLISGTSRTVDISNHETLVDLDDPDKVAYGTLVSDEVEYQIILSLYNIDQNDAVQDYWDPDYYVGQKIDHLEIWTMQPGSDFVRHWRFDRIYVYGVKQILDVHQAVQTILTFHNSKFIDMVVDNTVCND